MSSEVEQSEGQTLTVRRFGVNSTGGIARRTAEVRMIEASLPGSDEKISPRRAFLIAPDSLHHNSHIQDALRETALLLKRIGAGTSRIAYELGIIPGTEEYKSVGDILFPHKKGDKPAKVIMKVHKDNVIDLPKLFEDQSLDKKPVNLQKVMSEAGTMISIKELRNHSKFNQYEQLMSSENCIVHKERSGFYMFKTTKGEIYVLQGGAPNTLLAKDTTPTYAAAWISFQQKVETGLPVDAPQLEKTAFAQKRDPISGDIPYSEFATIRTNINEINDIFILGREHSLSKSEILTKLAQFGEAGDKLVSLIEYVTGATGIKNDAIIAFREFVQNAINYTRRTGLVVDINGEGNVILTEDAKEHTKCEIIDGFIPESESILATTQWVAFKSLISDDPYYMSNITNAEAIQMYVALEYVRALNIFAYFLDIEDRLDIFTSEDRMKLMGGKLDTVELAYKIGL